jgi:hypothetical protein
VCSDPGIYKMQVACCGGGDKQNVMGDIGKVMRHPRNMMMRTRNAHNETVVCTVAQPPTLRSLHACAARVRTMRVAAESSSRMASRTAGLLRCPTARGLRASECAWVILAVRL